MLCMAYICLHLVDLYGKCVGKYTSPSDPLVLNLWKFAHGLQLGFNLTLSHICNSDHKASSPVCFVGDTFSLQLLTITWGTTGTTQL